MITAVVVSLMALVIGLTWLTVLLSASALLALAFHTRRTVLDQWLMVVAFVSIGELAFSGLIPTVRFSAGLCRQSLFAPNLQHSFDRLA